MNKKRSLQWKLTVITAFIVVVSCLSISYFISKSAMLFFVEIEDSAITLLPEEKFAGPDGDSSQFELELDPKIAFSDVVQNTTMAFWTKSLLITLLITLLSSSLMYIIMGKALKPLQQLSQQVEEIRAKNLQSPVVLSKGSIEIERLASAFNEMLSRLDNAFSAQKQFSANAAHELRTPLAVMRTRLEVLEKSDHLERVECRETLTMLRAQIDRLSHVIDLLLEMTELQSAEKNDRIQLAEIVEEVLCDLDAVAEKKQVQLEQKAGEAVVSGNDMLIYRAIYNLIENAIKYNRQAGQVTIAISQQGEFASVQVADSGKGIQPEDWEHIFEPFYRVDKSRSRSLGGAGLGLALVKEIANWHDGNVRVLASSNAGSLIELRLPLASQSLN